jgi:hypothetical protein
VKIKKRANFSRCVSPLIQCTMLVIDARSKENAGKRSNRSRQGTTVLLEGEDPVDAARETIDVLAIKDKLQRNALSAYLPGEKPLTNTEIQAAKILIDKRMPAAVQQIDINARVEVTEKRALLDDIVALLSSPGADTSVLGRSMPVRRAAPPIEQRLAREDGAGPEGWEPDTR